MKTFGERLLARRKELGLTQLDVAKATGVSHVTISQWEMGDTTPRGRNLFPLSVALKCAPDWLLNGGEQLKPLAPADSGRQLSEDEEELLELYEFLPMEKKTEIIELMRFEKKRYLRLMDELIENQKKILKSHKKRTSETQK